jgi:hypothetical protein
MRAASETSRRKLLRTAAVKHAVGIRLEDLLMAALELEHGLLGVEALAPHWEHVDHFALDDESSHPQVITTPSRWLPPVRESSKWFSAEDHFDEHPTSTANLNQRALLVIKTGAVADCQL